VAALDVAQAAVAPREAARVEQELHVPLAALGDVHHVLVLKMVVVLVEGNPRHPGHAEAERAVAVVVVRAAEREPARAAAGSAMSC
jgi:hypothetical protein